MRKEFSGILGITGLIVIILMSFVASFSISSPQITSPGNSFNYLKGQGISVFNFNPDQCKAGQDFIVQVPPFGCEPTVVRSDLLEDQNVPVFCQLSATKINPLISVNAVDFISFQGQYPTGVSGVGFHPANAAVKPSTKTLLNSPVLNNIGYAVIVLKQQPNESSMPDFIEGNLTASIKYNIENAFGIGNANLYLPYLDDSSWEQKFKQYGFWNGKGFLRAEDISNNGAIVSVYTDKDHKATTFNLQAGQTSDNVYLPGFYCNAALKLRLDGLDVPDTRAKLNVNGDIMEVPRGGKFLNNACTVGSIAKQGINKNVQIQCSTDTGFQRFSLAVTPKIKIKINDELKEVNVGDKLLTSNDNSKSFYVAYAGTGKYEFRASAPGYQISETDSTDDKDLFVYLVAMPESKSKLTDSELNYMVGLVKRMQYYSPTNNNFLNGVFNYFTTVSAGFEESFRLWFDGEEYMILTNGDSVTIGGGGVVHTSFIGAGLSKLFGGRTITLLGTSGPENKENGFSPTGGASQYSKEIKANYGNAMSDYRQIIDKYPSEKETNADTETFGEKALVSSINLAKQFSQLKDVFDLCEELKSKYPNSKDSLESCNNKLELSNSELSSQGIYINGNLKTISIDGVYEPSIDEYSAEILVRGPSGNTQKYTLTKNQLVYVDKGSEEIYSIDFPDVFGILISSPIYYKYFGNEWQWSPDKINWMSVSTLVVSGGSYNGKKAVMAQQNIIDYLKDKNLQDGKDYLLKYSNVVRQDSGNNYIQLIGLDSNFSILNVNLGGTLNNNQRLSLGASNSFRSQYTVTLTKINLKKQARVSILPNVQNTGSQANFSFRIGIEKRAIQLSPEKINEKITNLNASISKWQKNSDHLGDVAKGFNGLCLVTGTTLTAKNFFSNLDGRSIARQEIMRNPGGWMDVCKDEVAKTPGESLDSCLLKHSGDIDKDVDVVHSIIQNQNTNKITEGNLCTELGKIGSSLGSSVSNGLTGTSAKSLEVSSDLSAAFTTKNKDGECDQVSLTQARDLERLNSILSSTASKTTISVAQQERYKILSGISDSVNGYAAFTSFESQLNGNSGLSGVTVNTYGGTNSIKGNYGGGKTISTYGSIPSGAFVQAIVYNNKQYLLELTSSGGNNYAIKNIYDTKGENTISQKEKEEINGRFGKGFQKLDATSYHNTFVNPEVKYFETEPYKGKPALVPFDLQNGWYAATEQTLSGLGNIRAYDESGQVGSFWICNVGPNGRAEFSSSNLRDDACQQFNPATGIMVRTFTGLDSPALTAKLISNAQQAISDASRQYKSGVTSVRIVGVSTPIRVGSPAVNIPETQCQDFMSPSDCNKLFNACDPVVCPSSRCNLGGNYQVADVVQSGIVGSTLLCLPNFPEVKVPVCISGLKAGLDNYVSVQKNYRDCLQENLATGKTIGICDEINSIYMCDFFWNQAAPLSQVAIPKLFEFLTGQGARGGGEYLGVQAAWQNAQSSLNYITNYYGADSFKAFQTQTIESIGGTLCKSFVSARYPSKLGFDSILAPKSPPQFTAWFSEEIFTTATVPATSQYKVFYHIFAGENQGAYYNVYLKNPVGTSYIQTNPTYTVASGYANAGDYASETKDFTAPAGYKELCISVNAQEQCGFQKVSTSFALNYLTQQYLASQAGNTNINSEAECVSGTTSAYSLINPNLQAGATQAINPQLYNQQIVRICSTGNPAQGTDTAANTPTGRWQKVGTCDNGIGKINCYLDTQSVKDAITAKNLLNKTLSQVQVKTIADLLKEGNYIDNFQGVLDTINSYKTKNQNVEITQYVSDNLIKQLLLNAQKARVILERGMSYDRIAISILLKNKPSQAQQNLQTSIATPTQTTATKTPQLKILNFGLTQEGNMATLSFESNCQSVGYTLTTKDDNTERVIKTDTQDISENGNYYTLTQQFPLESSDIGQKTFRLDAFCLDNSGKYIDGTRTTQSLNININSFTKTPPTSQKPFIPTRMSTTLTDCQQLSDYNMGDQIEICKTCLNNDGGDCYNLNKYRPQIVLPNANRKITNVILTQDASDNSKLILSVESSECSSIKYEIKHQNGAGWYDRLIQDNLITRGIITDRKEFDLTKIGQFKSGEVYYANIYCYDGDGKEIDKSEVNYIDGIANQKLNSFAKTTATITGNAIQCLTQADCQKIVGNMVGEVVDSVKTPLQSNYQSRFGANSNIDSDVRTQGLANNFKCLVLQVAMQESSLQHCRDIKDSNGDPFYCDNGGGDVTDLLQNRNGEQSYGVTQINIGPRANPDQAPTIANLESDVRFTAEKLVRDYSASSASYSCNNKIYSGWRYSLRKYNGWSTNCNEGDVNYVEHVILQKSPVGKLFSECA